MMGRSHCGEAVSVIIIAKGKPKVFDYAIINYLH